MKIFPLKEHAVKKPLSGTPAAEAGPTVTKAVLRAADRLGISNKVIGSIVGLSEATISRMGSGGYTLRPNDNLADAAREARLEILRYESVRDPERGVNFAFLACGAFAGDAPIDRQTWRIQLGPHGAQALCEFPDARLEFARHAFAPDPRIVALKWDRG